MWDALGGVDERFDLPGGGLVNADTLARACSIAGSLLVVLLGEATFHQVHGGVATNAPLRGWPERAKAYHDQYERLHGGPLEVTPENPLLLGTLPGPFLNTLVRYETNPPPMPPVAQAAVLAKLME
jgi:hypothetical protein